jgi:hypothetical protein
VAGDLHDYLINDMQDWSVIISLVLGIISAILFFGGFKLTLQLSQQNGW